MPEFSPEIMLGLPIGLLCKTFLKKKKDLQPIETRYAIAHKRGCEGRKVAVVSQGSMTTRTMSF